MMLEVVILPITSAVKRDTLRLFVVAERRNHRDLDHEKAKNHPVSQDILHLRKSDTPTQFFLGKLALPQEFQILPL